MYDDAELTIRSDPFHNIYIFWKHDYGLEVALHESSIDERTA
jgi:hypothetical protein